MEITFHHMTMKSVGLATGRATQKPPTHPGPCVVDLSDSGGPGARKRAGGWGKTKTQKRQGGRGAQALWLVRVAVQKCIYGI